MVSFIKLDGSPKIKDSDWVSNCYMLSAEDIDKSTYNVLMLSSANHKFTDTRLGGNTAINMPPAYTRFADPRVSGLNVKNLVGSAPAGLGTYWSEQIDDNAQLIHMQFGVPVFRGMFSFFTSVSNVEAGLLARTGRVPLTFFVGKIVGFVVGLRLLPFILVGKAIKYLMNRSGSKYYNFKPAMHPYWNRVNFIANQIAVAEGIVDRAFGPTDEQKQQKIYDVKDQNSFEKNLESRDMAVEPSNSAADRQLISLAHQACPELFREGGGVDVYRVASRYQELANARRKFLEEIAQESNVDTLLKKLIEYNYTKRYTAEQKTIESFDGIYETEFASPSYHDGVNDTFSNSAKAAAAAAVSTAVSSETPTADQTTEVAAAETPTETPVAEETPTETDIADRSFVAMDASIVINATTGEQEKKDGWFSNWWKGLSASTSAGFDGAFSWVCFKVNATGPVTFSASNSTGTPEIKSAINSFSSAAAKMRFNFSQGATGVPGIDAVLTGVKNAALGVASGLELAGLISLMGASFIDIPDTWEDSSANMPSESYAIHLRTPYGNALSRYMNLHIPYSMLLAGTLPISTGRQSYASPFICQLISVGRSSTRLGMIDNLSATHGVGNIGFTRDNKPLGMDINFSVKDLNRNIHAPIDTGGMILNPLNALSVFDDDNAFNEYINVLSGLSVADQILTTRRFERSVRLKMLQYESFFSSGHMSLAMTESTPGRALRSMAGAAGMVFPSLTPAMSRIQ